MDKYEFNIKVEQIKKLVDREDYETAMSIADTIDWRRVRNANLLSMISEVYEIEGEYTEAKEVLLLAYERAPASKRFPYKLTELALKEGSIKEAESYYHEFCKAAPDDPRRYLLRYMILKEKGASVEQLIQALEKYVDSELDENWMYELALLYDEAGMADECVQMCDKIILMFGLGDNVEDAMELKKKYAPLSDYQVDLVENRPKYEAQLKAVEEQYDYDNSINEDIYEDNYYSQNYDEELEADLNQVDAQRLVAEEMSRISAEEEMGQEEDEMTGIINHLMIEADTPEKGFDLAVAALKEIHHQTGSHNQVAKISGSRLNQKGVFELADTLRGRDLVVTDAGDLSVRELSHLQDLMTEEDSTMSVVLVDKPEQLRDMYTKNSMLAGLFEYIPSEEDAYAQDEAFVPPVTDETEANAESADTAFEEEQYESEEQPAEMYEQEATMQEPEEYAYEEEDLDATKVMPTIPLSTEDAEIEDAASDLDEGVMPDDAQAVNPVSDQVPGDEEEMDLDAFAEYACQYASRIDCNITGKSMLALYERIEIMEEDGIPLTRTNAEDLIEEAADKAEKPSLKSLFNSRYDKDGLLILREEHFI